MWFLLYGLVIFFWFLLPWGPNQAPVGGVGWGAVVWGSQGRNQARVGMGCCAVVWGSQGWEGGGVVCVCGFRIEIWVQEQLLASEKQKQKRTTEIERLNVDFERKPPATTQHFSVSLDTMYIGKSSEWYVVSIDTKNAAQFSGVGMIRTTSSKTCEDSDC